MREQAGMLSRPRALLSWSSGKDAAWALHTLRQAGEAEVAGLLTTLNGEFDRVAMHAVRRALLEAQAASAGLPLLAVSLPWPCSNAQYEAAMGQALTQAREQWGVTHIAFGDLFLEEVRAYRERQLAGTGLTPLFPLWGRPTGALAREMIAGGLEARLTCVDPKRLPASHSRAAPLTMPCSETCRRAWTRAARRASSTRSPTPGRCSRARFP